MNLSNDFPTATLIVVDWSSNKGAYK
jgi:hypothetical protein